MHGYDTYDYGARNMFPAVGGRFTTVDPLAELHPNASPYIYCFNNPINYVDPFGLDTIPANKLPDRWHDFNTEVDQVKLAELTVTPNSNSTSSHFVGFLSGTNRIVNGISNSGDVLNYTGLYGYLDFDKEWLRNQTWKLSKLKKIENLGLKSGKLYQKLKGLTKISSKLAKATKTLGVVGDLVSVGEIGVDVLSDGSIKPSSMVTGGLLLIGVIVAGPEVAVGLAVYGILDSTFDVGDKINKIFDNKELDINPF